LIDIGANMLDPMFRGIYKEKQVHQDDVQHVLKRALMSGVEKIIVTAGTLQESREALQFIKEQENNFKEKGLFSTVGCHPTRCLEFENGETEKDESVEERADKYFSGLMSVAKENKGTVVAIGECGLDYDRLEFCPKDVQIKYFERQFALAEQTGLPMFLHNRNTGSDFCGSNHLWGERERT